MQNDVLLLEELRKLVRSEMEAAERLRPSFLLESPDLLDEIGARKNKYAMKAVYLFGPAGAGKGFISNDFLGIPTKEKGHANGFHTYNPDNFIEDIFPAFGIPLKFANAEEGDDADLEEFQQKVRDQIQQWAKNEGVMKLMGAQPILFDTTGEKVTKMTKRIKQMSKLGYRIGVAQIYVPKEISVSRDQGRERTVGASRTAKINQDYLEQVVQARGYFASLDGIDGVEVFGDGVYPNLFELDPETGRVGKPLPGVTQEMLDSLEMNQQKAQALLKKMKDDAEAFVDGPRTETGEMLYQAQLRMIKITGKGGGRHFGSHSLADLEMIYADSFQEEFPEAANDPLIKQAAQYLASLGGVEKFARTKPEPTPEDPNPEGPLPGDKKELDGTLRSQDSKYKIDTDKTNPIKVGKKFPKNVGKGVSGPNPRQGRNPDSKGRARTRVREGFEDSIREIVRESVLRIKKNNL